MDNGSKGKPLRYYVCLLYCVLILIFNVWWQNHLSLVEMTIIAGIGILLSHIVSSLRDKTLIVMFILILFLICCIYSAIGVIQISIIPYIILAFNAVFIFLYLLSVDFNGVNLSIVL